MKRSVCPLLMPVLLFSSGVANAQIPNGNYTMTPACATGSRLDDTGGSTTNGNKLQIWAASGGPNQSWAFANVGGNNYNMSVNGPYCLDSAGATTNGTAATIWACNGNANQSWTATPVGGGFTFTDGNAGLCLDVSGAGTANGTKVDTWTCNGTNAQKWALPGLSGNLNPNAPPSSNFNLSDMYSLQLPTGSNGNPTQIFTSQLDSGYTDSPYFYTDPGDGSMVMMDPQTGWATNGSEHPRTELHENANWSTSGINVMNATLNVTQVPSNTTIAQIFQGTGPLKPLCELQFNANGNVTLFVESSNQGGQGGPTYQVAYVGVGNQFSYSISLEGTTISVSVNGTTITAPLPSSFDGEEFFFKAGNYDQSAVNGTPSTANGETVVKFYALNIFH